MQSVCQRNSWLIFGAFPCSAVEVLDSTELVLRETLAISARDPPVEVLDTGDENGVSNNRREKERFQTLEKAGAESRDDHALGLPVSTLRRETSGQQSVRRSDPFLCHLELAPALHA